jgi:hypothetical protein
VENYDKKTRFLLVSFTLLGLISACSTTQKQTQTARSAIEQLLLSEAIARSLPQKIDPPLPIPDNANVKLDISGSSIDKDIMRQIIAGWLGERGYIVQDEGEKATHRIHVVTGSLGTESGNAFFGMPPVQAALIPIALPELALYKAVYQTGYVKFYFNISEFPSGRFIQSTPPYFAETYYNDYTILTLFSFVKTDLLSPPQLGSFRESFMRTQTRQRD